MSVASSRPQSLSPRKRPTRATKTHVDHTGCYVSDTCVLEGTITLQRGCVLHPKSAIIVAPNCSVTFAPGCVVEENAVLHFPGPGQAYVGQGNVFQVGCAVDLVPGQSIGEWNTFAPRSRVKSVRVGDWCTLGACTALRPDHPQLELEDDGRGRYRALPSYSVVYGSTAQIRKWDGSGKEQELAVRRSATEFLREILPKQTKREHKPHPTPAPAPAPVPPQ